MSESPETPHGSPIPEAWITDPNPERRQVYAMSRLAQRDEDRVAAQAVGPCPGCESLRRQCSELAGELGAAKAGNGEYAERLRQAEAELATVRAESEGYGLRLDRARMASTQAAVDLAEARGAAERWGARAATAAKERDAVQSELDALDAAYKKLDAQAEVHWLARQSAESQLAEMRRTAERVQDRKIHYRDALEKIADPEPLANPLDGPAEDRLARIACARDALGEAGDG